MGTPGYSPPEAIREGRYTPQADIFAWGAVMYELLSGRIPYEGPDTKTTNSFVVKGDAPPPTHYDSSIPEPLSDVVMRALSPGSSNRIRDGADAEAALKEAWERCLREGLVSPMALAGDEIPHEKVGATMHGHVTNPLGFGHSQVTKIDRPPAPGAARSPAPAPARPAPDPDDDSESGDVGQVTQRREPPPKGPPTRPAGKPKAGRETKKQLDAPYVIESGGRDRVGDDDPTRILVRPEDTARGRHRSDEGASTERDPSGARADASPAPAPAATPAALARKDPRAGVRATPSRPLPATAASSKVAREAPSEITGPGDGVSAWLIALIVIVVLAGGGFAAWWFGFR
jgi:hypothetical protein